jgi:hypothetical protein
MIWGALETCWNLDPLQRPRVTQIRHALNEASGVNVEPANFGNNAGVEEESSSEPNSELYGVHHRPASLLYEHTLSPRHDARYSLTARSQDYGQPKDSQWVIIPQPSSRSGPNHDLDEIDISTVDLEDSIDNENTEISHTARDDDAETPRKRTFREVAFVPHPIGLHRSLLTSESGIFNLFNASGDAMDNRNGNK